MPGAIDSLTVRFVSETRDLVEGIRQSNRAIDRFVQQTTQKFRTAADSISVADFAAESLGTTFGNLASDAISGVGRALADVARQAVSVEKAFAEVQTIADSSQFPLRRIRDLSRDLSSEFSGSIESQAKALYQTISSGVTEAAAATETLNAANTLSIGGLAELDVTIDGLTSVLNSYASAGLTANDAADTLFTTVRLGKTTISELSSSIGQVASISAAAEVPFSELNGAIAALTLNGVSTSEAVTQVRSLLRSIINPTSQAAGITEQLGINFNLAELRSRGLRGFLEYLEGSGATTDQLSKIFERVEALNGVLGLSGPNAQRFANILEQYESRSGAANAAFSRLAETTSFQIDRIVALSGAITETFGNAITGSDAFKAALAAVTQALEGIKSLVEDEGFLLTLAATFTAIAAASGPIGLTATAVTGLVLALEQAGKEAVQLIDELESLPSSANFFREIRVTEGFASPTAGRRIRDDSGAGDLDFTKVIAQQRVLDAAEDKRRNKALDKERKSLAKRLQATERFLFDRRGRLAADAAARGQLFNRLEQITNISEQRISDLRIANAENLAAALAAIDRQRDSAIQAQVDTLIQSLFTEEEAIRASIERRRELNAQLLGKGAFGSDQFNENEARLAAELEEKLTALKLKGEQDRIRAEERAGRQRVAIQRRVAALQERAVSQSVNSAIQLTGALLAAQTEDGKAAFAFQQAASIAGIIVNTALAITRAYADLGPIAGGPAAAALAALGAAQIATVAATSIGGGGGAPSGGGAIPTNSRVFNSEPPSTRVDSPDSAGPREEVTIYAIGDAEVDKLVDLIGDRVSAGRVFINRNSRQAEELV